MHLKKTPAKNKTAKTGTKKSNLIINDVTLAECKQHILLRSVPCEVIQIINRKKMEILSNNPHRTFVSNNEAIYKLILKA